MPGNDIYRYGAGVTATHAERIAALEERVRTLEKKLERSRELLVEEELAIRGLG